MHPYTIIGLALAVTAGLTAAPARADLYKWVDDKGITNYSDKLPSDSKRAKKLAVVEDKLSVYTPAPYLMRAVEAARSGGSNQEARIRALEQQLEAERRARQYAAAAEAQAGQAARQAAYDQCVANRGIDCDSVNAGYYPYLPAVAVIPAHFGPSRLVGPHLKPGTIAGNVTAGHGIIPGNSAFASAGSTSRSAHAGDDTRRRTSHRR